MKNLFLLSTVLVFFQITNAQNEDSVMIKRISDEILINGKVYENLRHLTKKIGSRLAGSKQMVMAELWGEQMMKSSGSDRVIMQECRVPHWERGGDDKAKIIGGKNLDVIALGNSMGSGKNGVTAEVLLVNSFDELEWKMKDVKGKIVFYNYKFTFN